MEHGVIANSKIKQKLLYIFRQVKVDRLFGLQIKPFPLSNLLKIILINRFMLVLSSLP